MNARLSTVLLLTLGMAWTALAQGSSPMREGMWEVNTTMTIPGMGGMPPMTHQQCITPAMIKDPQSSIPKIDNNCKISNYKLEGTTASYTLTCTKPTEVTGLGEIKYSGPDSYTGTLKLMGGAQAFDLKYEAKRTGDCPK